VVDVLIFGFDDDLRMSYGVFAFLVDPGIERRHVDVLGFLSLGHVVHVMQFDGVRATSEEGFSGLERVDDLERVYELTEIWVGFDLHVPLAFPLDVELVAVLPEKGVFLEGGLVDFL